MQGGVHATIYVDARARRAAAAVQVVRPDPDADAGFVGRTRELAQLLELLAPTAPAAGTPPKEIAADAAEDAEDIDELSRAGVVVVSALAGAPGVGKTALAQAAARAGVARGWFPGGAVTVDLHGYDPDPTQVVWPAQLYSGLLRALGVPGEQVPPGEDEQATAYHQVLDQLTATGRPVLIVLDNVGDPDQAAPLLPHGRGDHRILVTSRDTLARLPHVRLLDLHVLHPDDAVDLLKVGLHRRDRTDRRAADDPDVAARLVGLCGLLPLAVQIVAALLGDEPDRPLAEMVADLTDERRRLAELTYDGWAVRAAFDLSYRRLEPGTAALFRWLAAVPGPDVGLAVAAAVADRDEPTTRAGLRALCRAHLLEQQPAGQPGQRARWRMHDLIHLYASDQLSPEQHATGFGRVLDHYRHTTRLASQRFVVPPTRPGLAVFTTAQNALAWVLQERAGIVAATVNAAQSHPDVTAVLAASISPFLERARMLADWVTVASAAAGAVHDLNPLTAAGAWTNLGLALIEVRRFDEAMTASQQARDLFRDIGDHLGEAMALNNFGNALMEVRRFDDAITAHQTARDLFRNTGDRHREAAVWNNLGNTLREVRRFDDAITAHQTARDLFRDTEDRHGEAMAWNNLGTAMQQVRRFDDAITAHQTARDLHRDAGDHHDEAQAWTSLGLALREVRRFDDAITAHQTARDLFRNTGDRHGEAMAWNNLGNSLRQVRRFDDAITAHQTARNLFRDTGDHHREATAWTNLGNALTEVRRFDDAITIHQTARELYRDTGDRHSEAMAWNNLGPPLLEVGRFDDAITAHQTARDLFRDTGDRHSEAMAWNNLGNALTGAGRSDDAITAHETARELYRETGDRHREATAWNNLGNALVDVHRFDEAVSSYETAINLYGQAGDQYGQAQTEENLGVVYVVLNQPEQVRPAWTNAVALYAAVGAEDDADRIREQLEDLDSSPSESA